MATVVTLQEITRTGGTYGFAVWRLNDNLSQIVYVTQAEYDLFAITNKGVGELPRKPAPDAVFMMASGGLPIYNTPSGRPRIGDFYVANTGTRETWFFLAAEPEWAYGYSIADAPAGGFSRLQGRQYAITSNRFIRTLTNPQLNNLRSGTFNFSNAQISIVNNVATIQDVLVVVTVIDRQIRNHRSVTFDSQAYALCDDGSPTIAGTVATQSDRYICALNSNDENESAISTIAWNGTGLTSRLYQNTNNDASGGSASLWDLVAPAQGSFNMVWTHVGNSRGVMGFMSFYGVDQTTPRNQTGTNFGSSTSPTLTLTSAADEICVVSESNDSYGSSAVPTLDATWTGWDDINANNSVGGAGGYKIGSASTVRTDTLPSSQDWAMVGASLKAAGGNVTAWLTA